MAAAVVPSLPRQLAGVEPMTLSMSFAPIAGKTVEKIQSGAFVDFKELLLDNVELKQRLQDLGVPAPFINAPGTPSRLREVQDPLTWVRCFLLFLAARVMHQDTRDLAAYAVTVIDLALAHGGRGWCMYDSRFRQQKAAGGVFPWTEINSSIMANTIFSFMGNQCCDLCLVPGHTRSDCALVSIEPPQRAQDRPTPQTKPAATHQPYNKPPICRRFNRGTCFAHQCRFEHMCAGCKKTGHPVAECPLRKRPASSTPRP